MSNNTTPDRNLIALALTWLVVLLPAAWGVSQVVLKSAALFH